MYLIKDGVKEGNISWIILAYGLTTDAILNVVNSMYPGKNVGLCTTHQTLEQKTRA